MLQCHSVSSLVQGKSFPWLAVLPDQEVFKEADSECCLLQCALGQPKVSAPRYMPVVRHRWMWNRESWLCSWTWPRSKFQEQTPSQAMWKTTKKILLLWADRERKGDHLGLPSCPYTHPLWSVCFISLLEMKASNTSVRQDVRASPCISSLGVSRDSVWAGFIYKTAVSSVSVAVSSQC